MEMTDQVLREHCIYEHHLRPEARFDGQRLREWHDRDHTVIKDHSHGQVNA